MGFHGGAAADKPKIIMRNAERQLEWCKAYCHWSLEEVETLHHLAVQWTNLGLVDARTMLPA